MNQANDLARPGTPFLSTPAAKRPPGGIINRRAKYEVNFMRAVVLNTKIFNKVNQFIVETVSQQNQLGLNVPDTREMMTRSMNRAQDAHRNNKTGPMLGLIESSKVTDAKTMLQNEYEGFTETD